ncbi:MAG: hypothetical protein Fur0020_12460 [Thermodesulfovibrionia bacterium]
MIRYLEAIEGLPEEFRLPLMRAFEFFREEIAETVKRSDFEELKAVVRELAEAQKRTEQRITRLEGVVEELAEAQKRTEEELRKLIQEHEKTREMLGGLSDTVGYGLEDKIMPYISEFAKREYAVETLLIDRRNIIYPDGRFDEINIFVEGRRNGERVYLIGECKARPGKKEIARFSGVLNRVKNHLNAPVYPFIVGYYYSPDVEKYLKDKHPEIKAMKSFEFEMKYSKKM